MSSDSTATLIPGRQPSAFYIFCYNHLPQHRRSEGTSVILDVKRIASDIGVSKQKVYLWLKDNKLPSHRIRDFLELTGNEFTYEKLSTFVTPGRRARSKQEK